MSENKYYTAFQNNLIFKGQNIKVGSILEFDVSTYTSQTKCKSFFNDIYRLLYFYGICNVSDFSTHNSLVFAEIEPLTDVIERRTKQYIASKIKVIKILKLEEVVDFFVNVQDKGIKKYNNKRYCINADEGAIMVQNSNGSTLINTGSHSALFNFGFKGTISNHCWDALIYNVEPFCSIYTSGIGSTTINKADYVNMFSDEDNGAILNVGRRFRCMSTGWDKVIFNNGDYASITSYGTSARIISLGEDCIIQSFGINTAVKAQIGTQITLSAFDRNTKKWQRKTEIVDDERIKEGVFYRLDENKFEFVEDNEAEDKFKKCLLSELG